MFVGQAGLEPVAKRLESGTFTLAEACSWPPPAGTAPLPLTEALQRLLPVVRLTTWARNQRGQEVMPGTAVVQLPRRAGAGGADDGVY